MGNGEREGSVVCLGDAVDDRKSEANARVGGAYAFRAAMKRLDEGGGQLWRELLSGVLDCEHSTAGLKPGRDPHGAALRQVVDDRVVHEVCGQLQQQSVRADRGGQVSGGVDGDPVLVREREERLHGVFRQEGQVHWLWNEGPVAGPAEQEQRLGEVDRAGIDDVEALEELAVVAVRVAAGHVEQCLRDRQRCAQFVGGVGGEPLLFGDVCFESREHGVEGVGELAELVSAVLKQDSVGQ